MKNVKSISKLSFLFSIFFFLLISNVVSYSANKLGESFTSITSHPEGWTTLHAAGENQGGVWTRSESGFKSSPACIQSTGVTNGDNWLITSGFSPSSSDSLVFFVNSDYPKSASGRLEVKVSTTDKSAGSFHELKIPIRINLSNLKSSEYQRVAVSLSNYSGMQVYIGFRHLETGNKSGTVRLDNITVGGYDLNLTALVEGHVEYRRDRDSVTVEIRSVPPPQALIESKKVLLDTNGNKIINFTLPVEGLPYYIRVKHRNSIATWSRAGGEVFSGTIVYDFTTGINKAFGNNMKVVNGKASFYAGDVNQDGIVDLNDYSQTDNAAKNYLSGSYLVEDLNWDGFVDVTDMTLCDNNVFLVAQERIPFLDSLVGTLASFPNQLLTNTPDTVLFRFTANPGVTFIDSLVKLIRVDDNNNEVQIIGNMYDNGNLAIGDEIARDNIYSGKFVFSQSTPTTLFLKTKGKVSISSTKFSQVLNMIVYTNQISTAMAQLLQTQQNAQTQLQTLLGGNPGNIENAANQLKTWLEGQSTVESVEKGGSTSMIIKYTSGLTGGLVFSLLNGSGQISTRGGTEISDTTKRRSGRQIPIEQQTVGTNFLENQDSRMQHQPEQSLIDPNAIGNRNVLIYAPYENAFAPFNERTNIVNRLNSSTCKGFSITSLTNQQANIASLYSITNYGYVVLATHGSLGKFFATGEILDTNLNIYKTSYKALLQAGKLAVWRNMTISTLGGVNVVANIYAAASSFIADLPSSFPNTVVLNNSCESTMNANLSNAFLGKGAKTYYGYTKVVNSQFCVTIADSITKRIAVDGKTTGQAFFPAIDPQAPNAVFEIKVGNNGLKYPTTLINNDFELGTIDGWTKAGDGRVISRLGFLAPTQGNFMGIISTGLGYTDASGSISQCLNITNTQSTLSLKWNFLSEEFLEYIGSIYQDYFEIKLITQNGASVILYRKTVDQIAADFGATTQNPGQLIAVSPAIVFDQGGVYMTNWQNLSMNVVPYRGQTVTIVLSTGDVGDSIFDSVVLLDEVSVQ